jgi:acyl-CoA synthetase (NDP forming)
MRRGFEASGKPVFLVPNHPGSGSDPAVISITREGFPVLDGVRPFLIGVRCMLNYRDFKNRQAQVSNPPDPERVENWLNRLQSDNGLDECGALRFLGEFGMPVNPSLYADNESSLIESADRLGYPLVLKTATPGILHKSDHDGVRLNICNEEELVTAYRDLAGRLGPEVTLAPMVAGGVEMTLGMVQDEQFGPLITLGFGGVNIEVLNEVSCALPPFDANTARALIDALPMRALLDARRGTAAFDLDAYCETAAKFSEIVFALADVLEEIDLNPVIVHHEGCMAVDALVIVRPPNQ